MQRTPGSLKLPYQVLIVDDDAMLAHAYEKIIKQAGGKPISVGNDRDAKAVVIQERVDAVLLDVQRSVGDDMQLLEWMSNHVEADQALVVLSNHDDIKDITRAYQLGADRYVLKAWASPNDLIRVINETLEHQIKQHNFWQTQN